MVSAVVASSPKWPVALRVVGFTVALCAVVVMMGAPRAVRRGCVGLANQLLGTDLSAPLESPMSPWGDRLRTSAYLAAHMAIGAMVTAATWLSVFAAVVFVAVWSSGGGPVASFGWTIDVRHGWQGLWTLLVSAGCLTVAACVAVGGALIMRSFAQFLLGITAAERLASVEEQLDRLAQRNRLAQELHDSIGHTLTASTIQAAVAGELMDSDPQAARRALSSIEETSRAAMDDLDHVLGVLREGRSPTAPQHTLADLGPLTERVRQAGAGLRVVTFGDLTQVQATVSREAYRIIQEGLTNALRHSEMTEISLRVAVQDGCLEVELINPLDANVPFRPDREQGHGLTGIAERVRLLRGEVSAGRTGERGTHWRLIVRIPLRSVP
ncbi:histidine kinase [Nocardia sp. NPDC004604]|uniref:sensor histidine kinase n=1 Tax=Nocardia sp. NPDC004604 TaxID=3157013 RepID=UPI0033A1B716